MSAKRIIAVGLDPVSRLPNLLDRLKEHGYELIETPNPSELPSILKQLGEAIIVVYSAGGKNTAHEVLALLAEKRRQWPVIVLVDRSDLDQYYELMTEGAFDYFELSSDPEWVEHAVHCAEHPGE